MLKIMRAKFLTFEEELQLWTEGSTGSIVLLAWNWKHQCECISI